MPFITFEAETVKHLPKFVLQLILIITENWIHSENDRKTQTRIISPSMSVWLWWKLFFWQQTSSAVHVLLLFQHLHPALFTSWGQISSELVSLTSRLMILRAVRCVLGVSTCMWTRSICDKLCRPEGDKQSWPSPAYSWTSKDRHWTDSSHTSWFSVGSCRETHSLNAYKVWQVLRWAQIK